MAAELHIELLLGRRVAGPDGEPVGRIEEVCAEPAGPDFAIAEYHLGVDAALERLSASSLSLFGLGRRRCRGYRVPWDKLDLSDPEHPRLICPVAELASLDPQ